MYALLALFMVHMSITRHILINALQRMFKVRLLSSANEHLQTYIELSRWCCLCCFTAAAAATTTTTSLDL